MTSNESNGGQAEGGEGCMEAAWPDSNPTVRELRLLANDHAGLLMCAKTMGEFSHGDESGGEDRRQALRAQARLDALASVAGEDVVRDAMDAAEGAVRFRAGERRWHSFITGAN